MRYDPQFRPPVGDSFDVIVIGGGINGVAIARECARARRRTLLIERHDFAAGTTSRSTRIIHGGLRYLEHGELGLVRDSLRERERLLRERPHLVRPMRFLLALDGSMQHRSALEIRFGLWLYRQLAGPCSLRPTARVQAASLERVLDTGRRWSIFEYDDAQCEFPERLVAEWLGEAQSAGAVVRNHTEALEITIHDGRARGVVLRDRLTDDEYSVSAPWIINATGPWADRVCRQSGLNSNQPMIGGVRGSHILLRKFPGAPESAVYTEAVDGRPVFVIPWNGQLLMGTTEVPDAEDPSRTQPSEAEVEYLLGSVNKLFPSAGIGLQDVRCAFAGVRPLPFAPQQNPAAVTRRHELRDHAHEGAAGLISVIGGKLTTAASLARDCAHKMGVRVGEPEPLYVAAPPADGLEITLTQWSHLVAGMARIPECAARAIAGWHGRRALCVAKAAASDFRMAQRLCPHTEHIVAEAVDAMRHECAVTLADVLLRRVPVALGPCWTEECSQHAADAIGCALVWSARQRDAELEAFEAERTAFLVKPTSTARSAA